MGGDCRQAVVLHTGWCWDDPPDRREPGEARLWLTGPDTRDAPQKRKPLSRSRRPGRAPFASAESTAVPGTWDATWARRGGACWPPNSALRAAATIAGHSCFRPAAMSVASPSAHFSSRSSRLSIADGQPEARRSQPRPRGVSGMSDTREQCAWRPGTRRLAGGFLVEDRDRDAVKRRVARLRDDDVRQPARRTARDPCGDPLTELATVGKHRRRKDLYTIECCHGSP